MVIATPLQELCEIVVQLMIESQLSGQTSSPGQHFLTPQLCVPESF